MPRADHIIVNLTPDGRGQFWNADIPENTAEAVQAYVERCQERLGGGHATATRFLVGEARGTAPCINPVTARIYEVDVETIPEQVIPASTTRTVRVA